MVALASASVTDSIARRDDSHAAAVLNRPALLAHNARRPRFVLVKPLRLAHCSARPSLCRRRTRFDLNPRSETRQVRLNGPTMLALVGTVPFGASPVATKAGLDIVRGPSGSRRSRIARDQRDIRPFPGPTAGAHHAGTIEEPSCWVPVIQRYGAEVVAPRHDGFGKTPARKRAGVFMLPDRTHDGQ